MSDEFCTSANGCEWILREYDERNSLALMQKFDLREIVARLLAIRGITVEEADDFLNPSIKKSLPDPSSLLDMDIASKRLADAIVNKEKIVIFGDYDVDGATSAALLKRFCKMAGHDAEFYIPDRIAEGYGPNIAALTKFREEGADVLVTVDCGTVSFEPLAEAKKIGLDVIVVDHHLGGETLPEAVAIVNPNRIDETSECRMLAAVGVTFMLVVAVNRLLRERNWYKSEEPDILSLIDLVAFGTICDMMPLKGVNRAFVTQGLKVMSKRRNKGLAALADVSNMDGSPSVYHCGFFLGPRINAAGRVGKAYLGARLLSTDDEDEANEISWKLDELNKERRTIEALVMDEAMIQADALDKDIPVIFIKGKGWHQGVVGIVASRLMMKYDKPVAAITLFDGKAKASARSVSGVDLGAAVTAARMEGLLLAGGGHAMAAGFTMEEKNLQKVMDFITKRLEDSVKEYSKHKTMKIDAPVSVSAINLNLARTIGDVGPFGIANKEPVFLIENAKIVRIKPVGENHIMCIIAEGGANPTRGTLKAMAFRAVGTPLGDMLLNSSRKELHLVGKVRINRWQGTERAEFSILDATQLTA